MYRGLRGGANAGCRPRQTWGYDSDVFQEALAGLVDAAMERQRIIHTTYLRQGRAKTEVHRDTSRLKNSLGF